MSGSSDSLLNTSTTSGLRSLCGRKGRGREEGERERVGGGG